MKSLVISTLPIQTDDNTLTNNKPLQRHNKIFDTLSLNGYKFEIVENGLSYKILSELDVINSDMLKFFRDCYNSSINVTDSAYIDKSIGIVPCNINNGSIRFDLNKMISWKQVGIWCNDTITPIKEDTYERIMLSAMNSYRAAELVKEYKLIYCLNIDPGHHAYYANYGGYCYLNNAAICTKKLVNDGNRVAILDLDHHAGNGTEEMFRCDENILTLSIHANPLYEYPFYSGHKSKHNLTFEPDVTVKDYMNLVKNAMNLICEFQPDILVIPFGADTYKFDPEASSSCRCCLDILDYMNISMYIRSRFIKNIIITQEGGYDIENVDQIVLHFLSGF